MLFLNKGNTTLYCMNAQGSADILSALDGEPDGGGGGRDGCGSSAPPGARYQVAEPWHMLWKTFLPQQWDSSHICFRSVLIAFSEALISCHLVCKFC